MAIRDLDAADVQTEKGSFLEAPHAPRVFDTLPPSLIERMRSLPSGTWNEAVATRLRPAERHQATDTNHCPLLNVGCVVRTG